MTAHDDAPIRSARYYEMKEAQSVLRTLEMAHRQVHALAADHPALAHLQAAADEVERVAFGYQPA